MKYNLKNYNEAQQQVFKILKNHSKTRNILNKRIEKAIKNNDVFGLITAYDIFTDRIIEARRESRNEANRILKIINQR